MFNLNKTLIGYVPRKDEIMEEMKSRGQSVAEVRRNEIRRKREMKLNKMKYMHNYGKSMFEGKTSATTRGNPKFESLKQKYLSLVEELNKKLASKKKEKLMAPEDERFDFETKPEKKENLKKMKEDINILNNLRETENNDRELKVEEADHMKKKKKRDREKGRRRKKTQDDMNILNNNNSMHINFLDDFQQDLEENKKDNSSSSDEGRRSVKSEVSGI